MRIIQAAMHFEMDGDLKRQRRFAQRDSMAIIDASEILRPEGSMRKLYFSIVWAGFLFCESSLGAIVAAEPNLALEAYGAESPVIHGIARTADGGYAVVGQFRLGDCRNYLRLRADFSLDSCASVDGPVFAVVGLNDGSDVIGGRFLIVNGRERLGLANIRDGEVVLSWSGGVLNGDVNALAQDDTGAVYVGGNFNIATSATVVGDRVGGIAKFSSNGTLNAQFNPVVGRGAWTLHPESGRLFFGGFGSVSTATFGYMDTTFGIVQGSVAVGCSTGNCYNPAVMKIDSDSSGDIYFSGIFDMVDDQQRAGMGRLTNDLVLDQAWVPFAWQSNRTENLDFSFDDRNHIYSAMLGCRGLMPEGYGCGVTRISTDTGVADVSMSIPTNAYAIVAVGGGVLVGGEFGEIQGQGRSSLARILRQQIFVGGFESP